MEEITPFRVAEILRDAAHDGVLLGLDRALMRPLMGLTQAGQLVPRYLERSEDRDPRTGRIEATFDPHKETTALLKRAKNPFKSDQLTPNLIKAGVFLLLFYLEHSYRKVDRISEKRPNLKVAAEKEADRMKQETNRFLTQLDDWGQKSMRSRAKDENNQSYVTWYDDECRAIVLIGREVTDCGSSDEETAVGQQSLKLYDQMVLRMVRWIGTVYNYLAGSLQLDFEEELREKQMARATELIKEMGKEENF